ncbi:MAG: hypothetical protein SWQ30_17945 [Thermodesulfobacteriota bacterium]|nr:hypothetical protein [Thermodesulfobacteriota bacterium]
MTSSTTKELKVQATTMNTAMNIITMTGKTRRGCYLLCLEKNRNDTGSSGIIR